MFDDNSQKNRCEFHIPEEGEGDRFFTIRFEAKRMRTSPGIRPKRPLNLLSFNVVTYVLPFFSLWLPKTAARKIYPKP